MERINIPSLQLEYNIFFWQIIQYRFDLVHLKPFLIEIRILECLKVSKSIWYIFESGDIRWVHMLKGTRLSGVDFYDHDLQLVDCWLYLLLVRLYDPTGQDDQRFGVFLLLLGLNGQWEWVLLGFRLEGYLVLENEWERTLHGLINHPALTIIYLLLHLHNTTITCSTFLCFALSLSTSISSFL